MKKRTPILLILTSFYLFGCSLTPKNDQPQSETNVDNSKTEFDEKYLESNYDFGDSSLWEGNNISPIDLGDCIIDSYPYDERYDWGQSIMFDSEKNIYKMWWCRHSRFDSIWYAESKDLKNWTNAQKVLVVFEDSTWIKMHVGKPSVLKINGEYRMYFEAPATTREGGSKEFDNNVFLATSQDGISWNYYKNGGNEPYPVLKMSEADMAASWEQGETNSSGYGFYGLGQPSVCYVNGKYYLYHTHALVEGDRMYVSISNDGIHFDYGQEVFVRAGCGVKFNELTNKFMLAYEYGFDGQSKVYYMESTDGVHFTYSNYVQAKNNKDVLSRNNASVHGYADFVGDEYGHVKTHTVYCAYMEGKQADAGNDWRQYSSTWDIHIAAFNPKEFANRAMVLPNHYVYNSETISPYRKEHVAYENLSLGISKTSLKPIIDGKMDDLYTNATVIDVNRTVCENCAVPGSIHATLYVTYDAENLYIYADIHDETINESDYLYILIDEKKYAKNASEVSNILCYRERQYADTGDSSSLNDVQTSYKEKNDGYTFEVSYPWRFKKTQNVYDEIGFDCFAFDNKDSKEYSSIKAWNDFKIRFDIKKAGSLYFKKG